MPRTLSATAAQAIFSSETSEVFVMLLTISHAALSPSLRFCSDAVDVVSNGDTYLGGWPFRIALPMEADDQIPTVQLQIDNVDRRILEGIRMLTSPPTITLQVVLASTPNTVEAGPFSMTLRNVEYDALVISGNLTYEDVLNEPWPQFRFTPNYYPGAF